MNFEARIARLERENRRLKQAGLLLAAAAGCILFAGQAAPARKTVQAESFVSIDGEGRPRAMLGVDDGVPSLRMTDAQGRTVVELAVPKFSDKPALYLHDPQLSTQVELAMTMNGPVLHFNDKSGNRIRLATNELNAPLAAVYDAVGKQLFKVQSGE